MMNGMFRPRSVVAGALALASVVVLSGCGSSGELFSDLGGDRQDRDELPALADHAYDNVDVSTSRFVGEHDGASVWLARALDGSRVCLIADAGDEAWVVGCGVGKVSGIAGSFEVQPDGMATPEGAERLSENVYAW